MFVRGGFYGSFSSVWYYNSCAGIFIRTVEYNSWSEKNYQLYLQIARLSSLFTYQSFVFHESQNKLGGTSISIHRPVQIYSKNSGRHLRVNGTKLDGWGEDGEERGKKRNTPSGTAQIYHRCKTLLSVSTSKNSVFQEPLIGEVPSSEHLVESQAA